MSRLGSARRTRLAVLLVLAASLFLPAAAEPEPGQLPRLTAADLGAQVQVGFGRGVSNQGWNVVEIVASPRVAVRGTVEVRSEGPIGRSANQVELEVAAGATKVVHVVVPPANGLQVAFRPDGGTPITLGAPHRLSMDVLVGGVDRLPALPDPLASVATDRAIRAVQVDPAVLRLGPRALESLDALVLTAAELDQLPADQRDDVAVAVAQGLDLVVVMAERAAAPQLPWGRAATTSPLQPAEDAWVVTTADLPPRPAATDDGPMATAGTDADRMLAVAMPAGRGRVITTVAAPGDREADERLWAMLFQPREDHGLVVSTMGDDPISGILFDSTLTLPGNLPTVLLVVTFLLAIGPANLLLLRRLGRRELGWVTVPAITVVFTLAVVSMAAVRSPTTTPVARASWWLDGVGQDIDLVGLQASSRQTVTATLPGRRDAALFPPWGSHSVSTIHGPSHTDLVVPLNALEAVTVVTWGPHRHPAPLSVVATFDDGSLAIEVENVGTVPVTDIRVGVATLWRPADDLAPGERTTVELDQLHHLPRADAGDRGFRRDPAFIDGPGGRRPGDVMDVLRGGVLDDRPGIVWAVGRTDDGGDAAPRVRGRIDDRGHVVAVGVTPSQRGDVIVPHQVGRALLRRADQPWRPGPTQIEGTDQVDLRFRLPATGARGSVVSTLDRGGAFRNLGMDPWSQGCFEVTVTTPQGERLDPEERCGDLHSIGCPDQARECTGEEGPGGARMHARLQDGSQLDTVRIADDPAVGQGALAGVEVWHARQQAWVPASDVFADGAAPFYDVVTPLGEVYLRVRGVDFLDFSQRGLGVGGTQ